MFKEIKENFCGVFSRMLRLVNNEDSAELGDRGKYIGASDIGKCGAQTVLDKLKKPEHSIRTLIRFIRGHVTELVVQRVLEKSGVYFSTQVELVHPDYPFVVAHIDCIVHDKPTLAKSTKMAVKEWKSPKTLPDESWDNQVLQINYQLGLLQLKYPHAEITGNLFNLSLGDAEFIEFGPYKPNMTILAGLVDKAIMLKKCVESGEIPKPEPSLLCKECQHKLGCSAYISKEHLLSEELVEKIRLYDSLRSQKKAIEAQMDEIKDEVVFFAGESYKNPVGDLVLSISRVSDSYTMDSKALKADLPAIWEKYKKVKKGYVKMDVL